MLVLSMNSKRQRRPNVRLGEIGDVSAAFACGFPQKTRAILGEKRWKHDFLIHEESEYNPICGFSLQNSSEVTVSNPGVPQMISTDMQHNNRENNNPNSLKPVLEFVSLDKIGACKSNLDFGTITRKCRVMKRRRRFIGGSSSTFSPEISSGDGKEYGEKEVFGVTSNGCWDIYHGSGFKDSSSRETSATSKEACENDTDEPMQRNSNGFWKEGSCSEGNNTFPQSFRGCEKMNIVSYNVNSVEKWLEEQGFGKYAGVFEIHEVDEEALPLLTLEDLKEMGVLTVGPRRKLYNAIQRLREGGEEVSV